MHRTRRRAPVASAGCRSITTWGCLAVSFSALREPPSIVEFDRRSLSERGVATAGRGRRLASVGHAMSGLRIEIRDETGQKVTENRIGSIFVCGPSITSGYFDNPE